MAPETMIAIDACKEHIASHKSFVLRGGAGSGKTESLKELLLYLYQSNPNAKVILNLVSKIKNGDEWIVPPV